MFCTRCGTELGEQSNFCSNCGSTTQRGASQAWTAPAGQQLTRIPSEGKVAGVCAGFARYLNLDVTLVRVLWVVITVFPLPSLGLISYIVAWIVMPKEPVTAVVQARTANGPVA